MNSRRKEFMTGGWKETFFDSFNDACQDAFFLTYYFSNYYRKMSFEEYKNRITHIKSQKQAYWAFKERGYSLKCIPSKFITSSMCHDVLKKSGANIKYVPPEHMNQELCDMAMDNDKWWNLYHIPEKYKTEEMRNLYSNWFKEES